MKKRTLCLLLSLVMAAGLTACGGDGPPPTSSGSNGSNTPGDSASDAQTYEYNVGASATAGQSYRWTVPMCELVNKYSDNITLNPITTTGSTENINLILSGEALLGVGPASTVSNAVNGKVDWEGNPATGIEFVYAYMPDYFYAVARENSPANTIADLVGKSISIGETGSGSYTNTLVALESMGYSLSDFSLENLSYTDATAAITEGWLDAYISYGSGTVSAFSEMQAGPTGLKVIPPSAEEVAAACAANSVYITRTMSDCYPGIDPIDTFGGTTALFASESIPDEVTYQIAKIINEHVDELCESFDLGDFSVAENSVDAVPFLPYAGGTEQYLKELNLLD